jgi:AmmeMemoRadiSam system protein B
MSVREPVVAGTFYPVGQTDCQAEVEQYLGAAHASSPRLGRVVGGIVPHAGWMCSGAVAARVFAALEPNPPETVVIFGAVHQMIGETAAAFASGMWRTPLGPVAIDEELASALVGHTDLIADDAQPHRLEHSIEVQVPFVRQALPDAKLLPIMVPPGRHSQDVGQAVADAVRQAGRSAAYVGSTDLTHYGPRYGFAPEGIGRKGIVWAKETNDRRMLDLILAMREDAVVDEARAHHNACGAGAIAATIAACRASGATRAILIQHTNSAETLAHLYGNESSDAVGYAAIVFTDGDST